LVQDQDPASVKFPTEPLHLDPPKANVSSEQDAHTGQKRRRDEAQMDANVNVGLATESSPCGSEKEKHGENAARKKKRKNKNMDGK
jgi:hypothetical protein